MNTLKKYLAAGCSVKYIFEQLSKAAARVAAGNGTSGESSDVECEFHDELLQLVPVFLVEFRRPGVAPWDGATKSSLEAARDYAYFLTQYDRLGSLEYRILRCQDGEREEV